MNFCKPFIPHYLERRKAFFVQFFISFDASLQIPFTTSVTMIIKKEFYDGCCSAYKKAIDELEQIIVDIKNKNTASDDFNDVLMAEEIQSGIFKFSRLCLTPFEYWNYYMEFIGFIDVCKPNLEVWEERCKDIANRAYFHLHYEEEWKNLQHVGQHGEDDYFPGYFNKFLKLTNFHDMNHLYPFSTERELCFPHSLLKGCFRVFEQYSLRRLPSSKLVKRNEEMKILYSKIVSAFNNVAEWFKLLLQVDDVDFVKHNVEFRLGQNLWDVELWKLYLEFLKEHGQFKWLLKTYSKYCRFFLDDEEMLEKYKKDMTEHGPVKLPWGNLFDFEAGTDVDFEEEKSSDEDSASELADYDTVEPLNNSICKIFYETYQVQDFALPKPIILYILENANHRLLRKLFSCCKYFYAKHPTPICYGLDTHSKTGFKEENLYITSSANRDFFVKNTYITGNLTVYSDKDPLFMSSLIPPLFRCEAKYISLIQQNLTFNELKFLIQHGGVAGLHMSSSHILHENGDFVDFETIMEFLSNVEDLGLPSIKVNAKTGHALSRLSFNGKLSHFSIKPIYGEPFDQKEFLKFSIAIEDDEKMRYRINFDKEFDAAFVEKFKTIFDDYKKSRNNSEDTFYINLGGGL